MELLVEVEFKVVETHIDYIDNGSLFEKRKTHKLEYGPYKDRKTAEFKIAWKKSAYTQHDWVVIADRPNALYSDKRSKGIIFSIEEIEISRKEIKKRKKKCPK